MSWGDEMEDIRSEQRPAARSDATVGEIARLKKEKIELVGAITRLLAKPRCGACRKAARLVINRIKLEGF